MNNELSQSVTVRVIRSPGCSVFCGGIQRFALSISYATCVTQSDYRQLSSLCELILLVALGLWAAESWTSRAQRANIVSRIFMVTFLWISLFFGICVANNELGGGRPGRRGPRK